MTHLERVLGERGASTRSRPAHRRRRYLQHGGDPADLPHIVPLAHRFGGRILIDEAHSLGVIGSPGAGVHEHFGLTSESDLLMGTFSKSFASIGGVAAADENVIHYIKHKARTMIFSASMPPYAAATVRECLRILKSEPTGGSGCGAMPNA